MYMYYIYVYTIVHVHVHVYMYLGTCMLVVPRALSSSTVYDLNAVLVA